MSVDTLYNGSVQLSMDGKHRYWWEKERIPSVTQSIGIIDKPALRFWFVNVAMDYVKNSIKPGESYDEIELGDIFKSAKFAHRRIANEAADIGRVVHDWIEECVKGRIRDVKRNPRLPVNDKAREAVKAFIAWDKNNDVKYLYAERKLFSKVMKVAGTVDIIAEINGEPCVIDIKTSKAVYPEYHLQTAAYAAMAHEEGITKTFANRLIIHVPKDGSGFSVHESPNSAGNDKKAFVACREVYKWKEGI